MNSMTYKGYLGSVAYSEKDQVFFGKIGKNSLKPFTRLSTIIWLTAKMKALSLIRVIRESSMYV